MPFDYCKELHIRRQVHNIERFNRQVCRSAFQSEARQYAIQQHTHCSKPRDHRNGSSPTYAHGPPVLAVPQLMPISCKSEEDHPRRRGHFQLLQQRRLRHNRRNRAILTIPGREDLQHRQNREEATPKHPIQRRWYVHDCMSIGIISTLRHNSECGSS